ncbi:MAG TPA: DNA methyltransferase, partial [Myxococcota bacterium]
MTTNSSGDRPSTARPRGKKKPLPSAPAKDSPGIKNPYVRFRPLEKPRIAMHDTTLWDFPSQHYGKTTQGDPNYRGATPSHVIWNVVARYTKKNDLVVDPFVGSGTSLDVARDLDRRGRGFDLQTTRDDVMIADARKALVDHIEPETAHLVFMDPPYANNLTYSDDPRCIGKRAFEDGSWSQAMSDVVDGAWRALKSGGHLACFVSDIMHVQRATEKEGGRSQERLEHRFGALGVDFARIALERGFTFVDHVAVVRRGKAMDDHRLKTRAATDEFMLRGWSHLLIFKKAAT